MDAAARGSLLPNGAARLDDGDARLARGDEGKNLRMKGARVAAGMSQANLAAAVGVTRQTIGLIESGGYNPTLRLCLAICKTLGCTLDDLFWDGGE